MGIKKRRLSLSTLPSNLAKAAKMNHSVGLDAHLGKEKLHRVNVLMEAGRFQEALPIIRQFLVREEHAGTRIKISRMQAICYHNLGKLR